MRTSGFLAMLFCAFAFRPAFAGEGFTADLGGVPIVISEGLYNSISMGHVTENDDLRYNPNNGCWLPSAGWVNFSGQIWQTGATGGVHKYVAKVFTPINGVAIDVRAGIGSVAENETAVTQFSFNVKSDGSKWYCLEYLGSQNIPGGPITIDPNPSHTYWTGAKLQ